MARSNNKRAGIEQPSRIFSRLSQGSEPPPYGVPPLDFEGTLPEWAITWALNKLGHKDDYIFQANLLGGRDPSKQGADSGSVADFYLPYLQLVIRVQGIYFHYEKGNTVIGLDQIRRLALEAKRFVVIDIDEDDALKNPIFYVKEALEFREHSKFREGFQ